ncbi:MAG: hypothetical protein Q8P74_02340, partial [bacterium]|nr:hypothetical protein [bacterium]
MDDIKKSILATVAYYDVLDFPLKAGEIFDRLVNVHQEEPEIEADKLKKIVELVREGRLQTMGGNYFLPGREYLVPLRLKKEKIWELKIKKARWAVRWLHFLPYIKGVLASGSLASGNTDELSDLDVLIIAGHGRIWTARFLVTGLLELLGVRRRSWDKIAPDKICLNHYITDLSLLINLPSAYNAQTYINLKPLILKDARLENSFKKENAWVLEHVKRLPAWDSGHKIE